MRLNNPSLLPLTCIALSILSSATHAQKAVKRDRPFIIAPVVYGLSACEEGMADSSAKKMIQVQRICRDRKLDGSPLISRLLDTLEPGGPKGDIQVGYTLTLPLLSLYQKTDTGWKFDEESIDEFFRVVERVKRPVVLYFVADHFDSPHAPLPYYLDKEPHNLMQLSDGKPLKIEYFNAKIFPWTLRTNPDIPVNRFRFESLDHVAKRVLALSKEAQERIVAITLAGELHQMVPNFESGMGSFDNLQYTDYSPESVADFRRFMQNKYQTLARLNRVRVWCSNRSKPSPLHPRMPTRKNCNHWQSTSTRMQVAHCRLRVGCGTPRTALTSWSCSLTASARATCRMA